MDRSHSRPHVSNDNPYVIIDIYSRYVVGWTLTATETGELAKEFIDAGGQLQDPQILPRLPRPVRLHRRRPRLLHGVLRLLQPRASFSGVGLHTAASVHYGTATEVRAQRAATLDAAYTANPARFRHQRPEPPKLPTVAWINQPTPEALIKSA